MSGDLALDLVDMREGAIPSNLQFCGDQAVLRIGGVILPEGPVGSVAGSLQIAAEGIPDLVATSGSLRLGFGGGGKRSRLDDMQEHFLNSVVDAQSTEGDATRLATVEQTPPTGIPRDVVLRARVSHRELAAAAP